MASIASKLTSTQIISLTEAGCNIQTKTSIKNIDLEFIDGQNVTIFNPLMFSEESVELRMFDDHWEFYVYHKKSENIEKCFYSIDDDDILTIQREYQKTKAKWTYTRA